MSDTPMPWDIPGAPKPEHYRFNPAHAQAYIKSIDEFAERAKEFVKGAPRDLHRHLIDDDLPKVNETLRLANELNEAVIAYRDLAEESVFCDQPSAEGVCEAADKLTGHLLEVINNK